MKLYVVDAMMYWLECFACFNPRVYGDYEITYSHALSRLIPACPIPDESYYYS